VDLPVIGEVPGIETRQVLHRLADQVRPFFRSAAVVVVQLPLDVDGPVLVVHRQLEQTQQGVLAPKRHQPLGLGLVEGQVQDTHGSIFGIPTA